MSDTNKFRELRLARAWSQEQLAEISGLSTSTVQRIENGDRPGLETLSALAAVFNVSVAELANPDVTGAKALDQRIDAARNQIAQESRFYRSLITAVVVCLLLSVINHFTSPASHWSLWVSIIWFALVAVMGIRTFFFSGVISRWQQKRLQNLLRR